MSITAPDPKRARPPAPAPRRAARRTARARKLTHGQRARWFLVSPFALALEALLVAIVFALLLAVLAAGREIPLPRVLADRVEAQAAALFAGSGAEVGIGGLSLVIEEGGRVRLRAEDIRLAGPSASAGGETDARAPAGGETGGGARIPALEAALDPGALLRPARAPRSVTLEGASLDVTRRRDGLLDFGFGAIRLRERTPAQAISGIRGLVAREAMAPLRSLRLEDLSLTFRDIRSGRTWALRDATLALSRGGGALAITLDADLPGRISLRLTTPEEGPTVARLSALVDGVPAADLAAQAPALGWLAPLQAPVSGALIGELTGTGHLGAVDGTLDLGAGRIAPEAATPIPFDRARAYFSYRPESQRLTFSALELVSPSVSLSARGHADLTGPVAIGPGAAWPTGLVAQLSLSEGAIRAGAVLPTPLDLRDGIVDAALSLDPLRLEIGQAGVTLDAGSGADTGADTGAEQNVRLAARGEIAAVPEGWRAALDLGVSDVGPEQVLALWPEGVLSGVRRWVARNVRGGRLTGAHAGMALAPGARPDIALSFEFRDAVVAPLGSLPPIEGGSGRFSFGGNRLAVSIEEGRAVPPEGGAVALGGSDFIIHDTTLRPSDGDLRLRAEGPLTAALSLIDQPPLRLLSRANLPAALADGQSMAEGRVRFPVAERVTPQEVGFDIRGTVTGVRSDVLVPGRELSAERLAFRTDPTGLFVDGRAALDGVALQGRFALPFGPDRVPANLEATLALTQDAAAALGVALPPGLLGGTAPAQVRLKLPRGAAAAITISSALRGLSMRLPGLDWTKPAAAAGRLEVSGKLGFQGAPPAFDRIVLEAPGLTARGVLALAPGGGLDRLTLSTARLGGWFDGALSLVGRGAGPPPAIELAGGTLDLPGARFAPAGGGDGAGQGPPIRGRLDRVRLAPDIALTGVTADLAQSGGGLSGAVRGRVNGGPEVTGQLAPGRGGRPEIRVRAADAGAVLAAAGVFEEAQGGALDLTIGPGGRAGVWQGALSVADVRVTASPVLVGLLNALSVVGLIERLSGPGLLFTEVRGDFRLFPGMLEVISASAMGSALGISAEGVVDFAGNLIDIRGVLSPIFALNSIGGAFSRRAGEGLFGFNYRVSGAADDPRIEVNPLSIFTPGASREILRGQSGQEAGD